MRAHFLSIKGATFTSAWMRGCQNDTSIDMLMYYDARPCRYNGLFDFYTNVSLKLDFVDGSNNYEVFLMDNNNDFQSVGSVAVGSTVEMKPNTVILFKSL